MTLHQRMIVKRDNLTEIDFVSSPPGPLREGECDAQITLLALTANNVTYAVAREELGYWDFFPVERPGWGCVPSWGFANITDSRASGVESGRRIYGYFPYASHLRLRVGSVNQSGFMDVSPHRADKADMYNRYDFVDQDASYQLRDEALISLFRPLFTTSFLIDDHLRLRSELELNQIVISSASSKTAMALAFLARSRADRVNLIGLTSQSNSGFVESLNVYDQVLVYDDVKSN